MDARVYWVFLPNGERVNMVAYLPGTVFREYPEATTIYDTGACLTLHRTP